MSATFARTITDYPLGTLAYLDTFSGLVKCRVESFYGADVDVVITANKAAYRKGERVTRNEHVVIPRDRIYVRSGTHRIRNGWRYVASA